MRLTVATTLALLSLCVAANAEKQRPFLCWGIAEVTGSGATYDQPGGLEIGRLDPNTTYKLGDEPREFDGEAWWEVGKAEVSLGWVKRKDLTKLNAGVRCSMFKEFFTEVIRPSLS
jgi:hypothetical protein